MFFALQRMVKQHTYYKPFKSWDNETTIPFRPVIEHRDKDAFLVEHPLESLKSGRIAKVPLLTGVVAQEAGYKSAGL